MWNLHTFSTFFEQLKIQVKLVLPSQLRSLADTGKPAWAGHELFGKKIEKYDGHKKGEHSICDSDSIVA